jgi:hypothetical protein
MGFRSPEEYWRPPSKKGAAAGKVFGQNIGAWVKIAESASYLVSGSRRLHHENPGVGAGFKPAPTGDFMLKGNQFKAMNF